MRKLDDVFVFSVSCATLKDSIDVLDEAVSVVDGESERDEGRSVALEKLVIKIDELERKSSVAPSGYYTGTTVQIRYTIKTFLAF